MDPRSKILGPTGVPIMNSLQVADVRPGQGGKVMFSETSTIELPGGMRVRFAPGSYLILAEEDWDRMVAKMAVELPNA